MMRKVLMIGDGFGAALAASLLAGQSEVAIVPAVAEKLPNLRDYTRRNGRPRGPANTINLGRRAEKEALRAAKEARRREMKARK